MVSIQQWCPVRRTGHAGVLSDPMTKTDGILARKADASNRTSPCISSGFGPGI